MPLLRRHELEVTSDRLRQHYVVYYPWLSDSERDAIGVVRNALEEIADGTRKTGD